MDEQKELTESETLELVKIRKEKLSSLVEAGKNPFEITTFDRTATTKEIKENLNYYKENAKIISETLKRCNIWHVGGKYSPYIWLKCPNNMKSWEFFDYLLEHAQVVGTPGAGFGKNGEGYFRLTSFGSKENTLEAMERIEKLFK